MLTNANGDIITQDFISEKFDRQKVEEIISRDRTPLPAGFPRLWFNVYGGKIFIINLTGVTLKEYII